MPNLNEFFKKKEKIQKNNLEVIAGTKPCGKCNKDAEESFWDPDTLIMSWQCPEGHSNQYRIN